jgi:hypothetical protein
MKKLLLILLCLPIIGFGQETFNVINNSKSKGLNFTITEPAGFERLDGKRPNILYNWLKNRDNLTTRVTISISITELPEEMKGTKEEWVQYLKFDSGVKDLTSGANNVSQEKYIVLESYPGVMFNSTKQIQRIDYERKTYNKTVLIFVEGKGFTINMSVSTKSSLEINEGIFMSMINSIIFPDQYN